VLDRVAAPLRRLGQPARPVARRQGGLSTLSRLRPPAAVRARLIAARPIFGPLARAAAVLLVALLGAWLGLLIGGQETTPVGPVGTHMTARPSWHGGTNVRVGPLGTLDLRTHSGPVALTVDVQGVNVNDAQHLVSDPASMDGLQNRITHDLRHAITGLVVRSAISAVLGALVLALLVFRRRFRRVTAVGATATALALGSFGTAAASWNPKAISEPRYTGLLAGAPALVGNAKDIVAGFGTYSRELAKLVNNVSKLYNVTSALPGYQPDPSTIRLLQVTDIHLNPAAWNVIAEVTKQFGIQVIVDSGDISDHGTAAERRFIAPIKGLRVPYVFVRGNHDSMAIQGAIAAMPNAVVLDGGHVREVAGLRLVGDGDPRFTPDMSMNPVGEAAETEAGRILAGDIRAVSPGPDIAVVHDPTMGRELDGSVPLVLAGHVHKRSTQILPAGTRLFIQGSTGGAGLRALEGAAPTPIECTVFYFDATTKHLQAWDDITLGGLGLASVQINRTLAPEEAAHRHATAGGPLPTPDMPTAAPMPAASPTPTPAVRTAARR